MLSVEEKIKHLKNLRLDGDFTEISKMYNGKEFNKNDPMYRELVVLSREKCIRFTQLSGLISKEKSEDKIKKYEEEKLRILDELFPGHGPIFGGGDGLFAIIGMVDLDGYNYINTRVHFNPDTLVHLEEYVFVAPNVEFGSNKMSSSRNQKPGEIYVGRDTWVGANVTIDRNTRIEENSVIGMGSHVVEGSKLPSDMISFGNPCKEYKKITEGYDKERKELSNVKKRTDKEIKQIIEHLQKAGITGEGVDFTEYIKSLKGEDYNTLEPTIARIFDLSHKLCSEYNSEGITIKRRKEILDILFPLHGKNLKVGDDLYVDCIGTVNIGDYVTIGDHVTLNGNISIGRKVRIKNGVTLQATGHRIHYMGRRLGKDENGKICEISVPGFIEIESKRTLAFGTKVLPNKKVAVNTRKGELYR